MLVYLASLEPGIKFIKVLEYCVFSSDESFMRNGDSLERRRYGAKHKKEDALSNDLSEISATDLEDYCTPYRNVKVQKYHKTHHRQKRKKEEPIDVIIKNKEHKKKICRPKKKTEVKVLSESSEESEDEYRNRRQKLAEAVVVNKTNNDKTSLSERLQKMLCGVNPEPIKLLLTENKTEKHDIMQNKKEISQNYSPVSSENGFDKILSTEIHDAIKEPEISCIIDICTDEDSKSTIAITSVDTIDAAIKENEQDEGKNNILGRSKNSDKDSDDDLELLRQHALKTKTVKAIKAKFGDDKPESKILSEDEDSDTTELRLICLKSALLKKAIEMKRKQKLRKRLSQSSNMQDESLDQLMLVDKINSENNTDIESVDMDIGSDGDDKVKENDGESDKNAVMQLNATLEKDIPVLMVTNEDELEEDEDLLRAKLLTSLSKNLPNLVNPSIVKSIESAKDKGVIVPKQPQPIVAEEKRFIINVESDSEGEHEATKNLTKMHMKLSEQIDFQQKLDMFLKSTRMEVEKTKLPDVVQQPTTPKKNEKYVVKAVKNLPKSEQIEYKNLVKRMAELEKIKQARQSSMNLNNKVSMKDTLKPRNVTVDASNLTVINTLEEKIKNSRKNIAEESAKMLKLKEEGTKLSQKFKIVATELRNIKTAIALNKKQQRSVQNCLTKIRLHHQLLLKSSLTSTHSKVNIMPHLNHVNTRLQKENNPKDPGPTAPKVISKESYKNQTNKEIKVPKTAKVGVTDDSNQSNPLVKEKPLLKSIPSEKPKLIEKSKPLEKAKSIEKPKPLEKSNPLVILHPRLSIEVDLTSNKKVVVMSPTDESRDKNQDNKNKNEDFFVSKRHSSHPVVEKGGGTRFAMEVEPRRAKRRDSDDYKSPLDAFGTTTWKEDPNAILCPFEVCGDCKDTDCKYLHTKTHSK